MKKYIIFLCALCMTLSGCYKEDPIHAELEKYWRDYDVNSTDPALKFVSQYWEKFDKVLLYDAQERDYVYNFSDKNDVEIINPTSSIYEKLQLFDELFMKGYDDEFKKRTFPFNVIIADKIVNRTGTTASEVDFFGSRNFLAFKITDTDLTLDAAGKKKRSAAMHMSFIIDYCITRGMITLNPQFDKLRAANSAYVWAASDLGMDVAYARGFFYYQLWEDTWMPDYPETPFRHSFRGYWDTDLKDYFNYMLNHTEDEIAEMRAKWPLINQKMGYVIEMLESIGIDYRLMK